MTRRPPISQRASSLQSPAKQRPAKTRRGNEPARRAARRRRRLIAYGTAAAVLIGLAAAVTLAATSRHAGSKSAAQTVGVGVPAPGGSFTTTSGATETIASLRGHPALVWFVATWCSSCQAGTQALASQIGEFSARGVKVVELELADDLGQRGPSIPAFAHQYAGNAYTNPDWTWGVASSALTTTYDPASYLDIYYLLDASGRITYVNSAPGSTMGQLLAQVAKMSTHA